MARPFPTGQVRYTRSASDFGTRPVELIVPGGRGETIEGHIRVPLRLIGTKEHTNERAEFDQYIAGQVKRWLEWRSEMGWEVASTPKVKGPVAPQIDNPQAEVPDYQEFWVRAQFRPSRPIYIGLEDAYEHEDRAKRYGVDLYEAKKVSSLEGQRTKALIVDHRPFFNPMEDAETRRQQYGLKRADFLMGDITEPLQEPK